MMHPSTSVQFIADDLGHGVVATAFIPKGTITWVQDPLDRVFSPAEIHQLTPSVQALLEYYAFRNARGEMVLCWDHARYVKLAHRILPMGEDAPAEEYASCPVSRATTSLW